MTLIEYKHIGISNAKSSHWGLKQLESPTRMGLRSGGILALQFRRHFHMYHFITRSISNVIKINYICTKSPKSGVNQALVARVDKHD